MTPFLAIERDDFDSLKAYKKENSFLDCVNSYGYTPLEWAYLLGNKKAAAFLDPRTPKNLKIDLGEGIKKIAPSEFYHFFETHYYPHLQFDSLPSLQKKLNEAPIWIAYTPVGYTLRRDGKKYRQEIGSGYVADTIIRWIDEDIGYGLFAGKDLLEGEYIAAYTGKVREIDPIHKDINSYCFHYPTRWLAKNYTVIDSLQQGNETRFINHSNQPNLETRWIYDRGLMHLCFFAVKFIPKGTQLTFNYGKDFWKSRPGEVREI